MFIPLSHLVECWHVTGQQKRHQVFQLNDYTGLFFWQTHALGRGAVPLVVKASRGEEYGYVPWDSAFRGW